MPVVGIVRYGNGTGNKNNCVFLARSRAGTDLFGAKIYFEIAGALSYTSLPAAQIVDEKELRTPEGTLLISRQPEPFELYDISDDQWHYIMKNGKARSRRKPRNATHDEYNRLLDTAAEAGFGGRRGESVA